MANTLCGMRKQRGLALFALAGSLLVVPSLAGGVEPRAQAPSSSQALVHKPCTYTHLIDGVTAIRREGRRPVLRIETTARAPQKLTMVDLCMGSGRAATSDDTITVDYVGVGYRSRRVFDSSYARSSPATFPLPGLIKGWRWGTLGMRPGGARLLLLPARMAYGKRGAPPDIKRHEALAFIVELRKRQVTKQPGRARVSSVSQAISLPVAVTVG